VTWVARTWYRLFGRKAAGANAGPRNRFEAAQGGATNRRHWSNADDLGPRDYASADTRRVLRRRARYERDNDPHLDGLMKTLANDMVGTGPRLQLGLAEEHFAASRLVEQSFAAWCRAVDLAEDLRLMHEAKPTDGESFAQFVTDPALPSPVKLDLRVLETEQVQTPDLGLNTARAVDGIEFDSAGKPAYYHVLREHPGDGYAWGLEYDRVPARLMVHWFRPRRAGQARGVSELASALEIGAQTRRYSAAVLSAAEFAAMLAGVLEQDTSPGEDAVTAITDWQEVEMTRGALLTLPKGTKASQFRPEQPTNSYKEFVAEKRNEMARPTLAPFNVISGNSSGYNYSSGRLDHVPYHRFVWIERERMRHRVLDKLFLAWLAEAQLIGLIPDTLPAVNEWVWEWQWDGFASIDPLKDTQASQLRLATGLTTLSEECAAEGKNWQDVLRQKAVEKRYAADLEAEYGVSLSEPAAAPATTPAEEPAGV
jgi:lambda family phage portal protein